MEDASGNNIESNNAGTYVVQVVDENGCVATSDPFVVVVLSSDDLSEVNMDIYPVPASNLVTIDLGQTRTTALKIYSAEGREVFAADQLPASPPRLVINIGSWASGVYVVKAIGEKGIGYSRIIKAD